MTKKFFFVLAAATALFLSCNKQEIEVIDTGITENVGLVVKVTVPKTKFAYTDEGASGLDLKLLNDKDRLIAYFRNEGGSQIGAAVPMNLDPTTLSGDKKSGTFRAASAVEIPVEAKSIFFYLDNEDNGMYSLTGASINNLKMQDGTLADVAKHQVIVGNAEVASLGTDGSGNKVATISFEYKTSVLKLAITFPDGVVPTADENTTIILTDSEVYNSVRVAWGEPHSSAVFNSKGAISVNPCSVSGQVATAYVTVWGGSEFASATLSGKVGDIVCDLDFDAAGEAVAGKIHNVARTLGLPNVDLVRNDDSQSVSFISGLSVASTDGPATYNSGTGSVDITANTTGKPRVSTVTFTNGSSVKVAQMVIDDFKGTWSFRSQVFSNNTTVITAGNDKTINLTFGDPLVGETLENVVDGNTYTNNIGVSGLYLTAVADAYLGIDYVNNTVKFGLFLDERKAQSVANGNATYPYVCFIPEGGTTWTSSALSSPWKFVPIPISASQNYQWLWFDFKNNYSVLNYDYPNKQVMVGSNGTGGTTIVGITCAVAKNATPAAADIYTTYNVIYQANPNKKMDTGGFTLTRQ